MRLIGDLQMLAIPRYAKMEAMDEPLDYLCFIYFNEERVLSDIIYGFKEFREYPPSVQEDLIS